MKYIIITGGIISGLGKGITSSSIGLLLKSRGINVTAIKIDPYLNIDAGTMSPFEHGECYVLGDMTECDLDIGNYERFLGLELTKYHNITTGKIYQSVINKERNGEYLGKTVQIVPHITNEIQSCIKKAAVIPVDNNKNSPEVCLIEVGGTIGDIETSPFIEAIRQMAADGEKNQFCFVHVSMIIDNGELKTKPTQHSVAILRTLGIIPNFLVLRTPRMLDAKMKKKLKIFCQISEDNIISNIDMPNIYYVPDLFKSQNICEKIGKVLDIKFNNTYQLKDYYKVLNHYESDLPELNLIMAGKYVCRLAPRPLHKVGSNDTYLSLIRAIDHASFSVGVKINIIWLNTEDIDNCEIETNIEIKNMLEKCHGVIILGGFGKRGTAGKIKIAKYTRGNKIPILGICLGLQVMVVEFARSIGINCSSTEWDSKTEHPIIDILPGQTDIMGGSLRLGNYTTKLKKESKVYKLYGKENIVERHRHRYEVNNKYVDILEKNGLYFVGKSKNGQLMEIVELKDHPFYIGVQYHPEFKSRYNTPHPLFIGLLNSAKEYKLKLI
uniref:CTP synthase (glutamine hydrolyzing) n=1 Tax=Mimivirus LCMiAC02 TaxID=2506609 RepID=A0A4P6VLP6_9VIRU|nr:MAG: CTP synthetase [Mimivirus LCMiAC02]